MISNKIIKFELIDAYKKFKNLTFKEVEELLKSKKERVEKVKKISLNHKLALYQEIEKIVENARENTDFDMRGELSKAQRLKNIRKNRKEAVKKEREDSRINNRESREKKKNYEAKVTQNSKLNDKSEGNLSKFYDVQEGD